jgi:hypothetical protein
MPDVATRVMARTNGRSPNARATRTCSRAAPDDKPRYQFSQYDVDRHSQPG